MKSRVTAVLLVMLLVPAAGAAEAPVESFVIDDTTFGLQRPVWLYRSAGTAGSAKHPPNLFVFLQKESIDELAVPALLDRLVAAGEIPPTIAVVLDTPTGRPSEIANRAKFDRFVTANLLPWLRAKLGRLPEPKNVVIVGFSMSDSGARTARLEPSAPGEQENRGQ